MSEQYDMIVIGAGISGLAMAFEAQQDGMKVLVLEKENRSGGCFDSAYVADEQSPFWLEMGTHTCFNSYGRLLAMLEKLELTDQMQGREKLPYRLLADDQLVSIPSRLHFFELLTHAVRLFWLNKEGKSVADYYRAIVGRKNYTEVFRHAFNAVVCQPADRLPADMLFRKRPRDNSVMRSYTFAKGLGVIVAELEKRLAIKFGQSALVIHQDVGGYGIESDGDAYACGKLVCATPALAASRLLKDVHPEITGHLNWVNEVEIESVGVVVGKDAPELPPVAGIIAVDESFYSAVSRDVVAHPQLRGFTFHFKPGVLGGEEKLRRICNVLGVAQSDLLHVFNKINRLPAPDIGHHQLIQELDAELAGKPLALVGNYFKGVAVEDCLQRVEKEFARLSRA